jgi:hypothetical protein
MNHPTRASVILASALLISACSTWPNERTSRSLCENISSCHIENEARSAGPVQQDAVNQGRPEPQS